MLLRGQFRPPAWPRRPILVASVIGALGTAPAAAQGLNWEKARDPGARYRNIVSLGNLAHIGFQIPLSPDANNLRAVCEARREGMEVARRTAEAALDRMDEWRDPVMDQQRSELYRALATVAAFTGDIGSAVEHLEASLDQLSPHVADYPDLLPSFLGLQEALGVGYMRLAELDNCLMSPSADRCLFPLKPGGIHRRRRNAEAAYQLFGAFLARAPSDLEVRWLLNVSAMVLGDYPLGLPPEQLLAPELFESAESMPRFVDVAPAARLGRRDVAGGTVVDDLDGDDVLDVVFSTFDYCAPLQLYRGRRDGTFEEAGESAGFADQLGGINLEHADYDNDGRLDLFVIRGGWESATRNSLLRNDGDGRFTDVTGPSGLLTEPHATHSVAWGDVDNDGWLDLFVGNELTPSQLFRNRGDGSFEDVTQQAGVGATAFTKGAVFGDYDKDGDVDLYVSNVRGPNFLYRNDGSGRFTDVATGLGVEEPSMSFPTWFFDYDNDGWLDILTASFVFEIEEFVRHYVGEPPKASTIHLYRNRGDGTFEDVTEAAGLSRVVPAMGANFGDIDNDGWLDVYLGTGTPSLASLLPNLMFRNARGRFVDVTTATGTGHLQKGHGVAFADIDRDGDQDLIVNLGGSILADDYEDALFENPGGYGNRWISVKLVGVETNRAALGARIAVRLRGGGDDSPLRYREVTSGGSFGSSSFTQHIGLGRATGIESLEVDWPVSRTRQVFHDVPLDRFIEIRELADDYRVRDLPRLVLGGGAE
jgi:hypothetical protein